VGKVHEVEQHCHMCTLLGVDQTERKVNDESVPH
jgi:hypothetical protein